MPHPGELSAGASGQAPAPPARIQRIAVLGDSAENQLRGFGLTDPRRHWIYNTLCGEQFRTVIADGRAAELLALDRVVAAGS